MKHRMEMELKKIFTSRPAVEEDEMKNCDTGFHIHLRGDQIIARAGRLEKGQKENAMQT